MAEKHQYFNGLTFTRDERTGYYLGTKAPRKRLHRYVWEFYNGEIPKGYDIHHIDGDKSNNDISNLQLIESHDHQIEHGKRLTDDQREWRRNNLATNARPKATEWHKSEEGKEWHKKHYERTKEAFHQKFNFVCINCGKEFVGEKGAKYCCNACKSAYRRKSGVDNITRICVMCGNEFITDKASHVKCCSKSCAMKLGHINRRLRNESKVSKENKTEALGI